MTDDEHDRVNAKYNVRAHKPFGCDVEGVRLGNRVRLYHGTVVGPAAAAVSEPWPGDPNTPMRPTVNSEIEPFVNDNTAAAFAGMKRAELLKQTRQGLIRGYPITGRVRHRYRYLLSEVGADLVARRKQTSGTIAAAAPVSQRRKSNGE